MNKLYITKVLPDGYASGVIPEMEKPVMAYYYDEEDKYMAALTRFSNHVKDLPTFLLHPSLNPKEGGWIEQWREGWEIITNNKLLWLPASKDAYDLVPDDERRKVILPLVEKKEDSSLWDWVGEQIKHNVGFKDLMDKLKANLYIKRLGGTPKGQEIYSRQECIYQYCPHAELCKEGRCLTYPKKAITPPPDGNTPASEQGDEDIEHKKRLKILELHLGSEYYRTGEFHNSISNAMKEYASQSPPSLQEREKGMKWVKASERLPKMETPVFLKLDGKTMGMGNFYEQDQCYMLYVQRNGAHDEYEKPWYSKLNIEWLDESEDTAKQSK